ncbi:hypothetical protein ALP39_04864 [Pseudomonas marginalis pv. marginalis]|nr:hypothetical protein ALP39_04864 [Pseudomonas marginalis pv. marginalis]
MAGQVGADLGVAQVNPQRRQQRVDDGIEDRRQHGLDQSNHGADDRRQCRRHCGSGVVRRTAGGRHVSDLQAAQGGAEAGDDVGGAGRVFIGGRRVHLRHRQKHHGAGLRRHRGQGAQVQAAADPGGTRPADQGQQAVFLAKIDQPDRLHSHRSRRRQRRRSVHITDTQGGKGRGGLHGQRLGRRCGATVVGDVALGAGRFDVDRQRFRDVHIRHIAADGTQDTAHHSGQVQVEQAADHLRYRGRQARQDGRDAGYHTKNRRLHHHQGSHLRGAHENLVGWRAFQQPGLGQRGVAYRRQLRRLNHLGLDRHIAHQRNTHLGRRAHRTFAAGQLRYRFQ